MTKISFILTIYLFLCQFDLELVKHLVVTYIKIINRKLDLVLFTKLILTSIKPIKIPFESKCTNHCPNANFTRHFEINCNASDDHCIVNHTHAIHPQDKWACYINHSNVILGKYCKDHGIIMLKIFRYHISENVLRLWPYNSSLLYRILIVCLEVNHR